MAIGRGLLVAAPRSGAGKTVVTIGLQRAFSRTGLAVAGAKCGPDYIDPAFHAAATGRPSVNLDGFVMEPPLVRALASAAAENADLVIAEGAMGLFDGARAGTRSGACADLAAALGWPVLLVIDADAAAQSIAAVAHGCACFPGAPPIAGVIVNRLASARHAALVAQGFARIAVPLLGMIAKDDRLALPSRHLGLVQAGETAALETVLDGIADAVEAQCDLAAIRDAARHGRPAPFPPPRLRPPGQRIAIARDEAFAFLYPHLMQAWRRAGAELRFFSPLADEPPPAGCDACWLPGGYPELHAGRLAASRRFLAGLRAFADRHAVHGECGGYMVLGRTIADGEGRVHPMAGLLPVDTSFARRRLSLGYRRAVLRADRSFAAAGETLWGHEFHYATITAAGGAPLADLDDGAGTPLGPAGHCAGPVSGSFFHLIA